MVVRLQILCGYLTLLSALSACKPAQQPDAPSEVTTEVVTAPNETEKQGLPFPVYKNFSELEPIFQYQNDSTYVINFWATWCKPCVEELPYFEELHTKLAGQKIKIILVSLDFAKDVETKLAAFVEKRKLQPAVIALTDGKYNDWISKVHPDWSGAIPVTYIYKKSNVLFHDQQYSSFEELEAAVKKIAAAG